MRNGSLLAVAILLCLAIAGWGLWLRYGDERGQAVRYKSDLVTVQEINQEMSKDFQSVLGKYPEDPGPFVLRGNERGARLDSIQRSFKGNAPDNLVQLTDATDKANGAITLYIRQSGVEKLNTAKSLYAISQKELSESK